MPIAQLISPQKLAECIDSPRLVLLDCRYSLEDADHGQRSYAEGHIAGAHFADLGRDLSAPPIKGVTGRHPLPPSEQLLERLQRWGISQDSQVVLYDDGPGAYAARAWWLLAWLGKRENVFLLDGGLAAWHAAGLPLSLDAATTEAGNFVGVPDNDRVVDALQLQERLDDPQLTLLDARALPRFLGEAEPIDPVAGHIPGAQCAAFADNLGPDGRFLPVQQLRERFDALLQGRPAASLIAYCGSGVTACHNLFAMALAGYPLATLYAGSWSDWITDPQRPVQKGA